MWRAIRLALTAGVLVAVVVCAAWIAYMVGYYDGYNIGMRQGFLMGREPGASEPPPAELRPGDLFPVIQPLGH